MNCTLELSNPGQHIRTIWLHLIVSCKHLFCRFIVWKIQLATPKELLPRRSSAVDPRLSEREEVLCADCFVIVITTIIITVHHSFVTMMSTAQISSAVDPRASEREEVLCPVLTQNHHHQQDHPHHHHHQQQHHIHHKRGGVCWSSK